MQCGPGEAAPGEEEAQQPQRGQAERGDARGGRARDAQARQRPPAEDQGGESARYTRPLATVAVAGRAMLPVPRTTLPSVLSIQ